MSFRCGFCKKAVHEGVKPHRIITEKRHKVYTSGKTIGHGWEIVAEVFACPKCGEKKEKELDKAIMREQRNAEIG